MESQLRLPKRLEKSAVNLLILRWPLRDITVFSVIRLAHKSGQAAYYSTVTGEGGEKVQWNLS